MRAQLKSRRGGAADSRLFCVVTTRKSDTGEVLPAADEGDQEAFDAAAVELERREKKTEHSDRRRDGGRERGSRRAGSRRSLVPDEVISLNELRRMSVPIYGMERWGDLFSPRQAARPDHARATRARSWGALKRSRRGTSPGLAEAVVTVLGLAQSLGFADI